jgi:predicted ribosome quality control (RQC) complex YloA/Tae2 family protein
MLKEVFIMSYDGFVTKAITEELKKSCEGGRITKIHQPDAYDLMLTVRHQNTNHKLFISAHPSFPRMHLTEKNALNPVEPPVFCMMLRKHCEGGIIERIAQVDMERIIHIDIRTRDELGDWKTNRLVIEIMGRHSNVILLDGETGTIYDAIQRVTPAISQYRRVLPGAAYKAPPKQEKTNPLRVDQDTWNSLLDFNQGNLDKQMINLFLGIGPVLAKEIVYQAGLPTRANLWQAFSEMMGLMNRGQYKPAITTNRNKSVFSVVPLAHLKGTSQSFASMSEAVDDYYRYKAEVEVNRQKAQDLVRWLNNEILKNERKIEKLKATLAEADEADQYRIYGELLTASMHLIQPGAKQVEVVNYYDENSATINIPLDPAASPAQNVQRYFKRYHKIKNSVDVTKEQITKAKEEIAYFDTILQQLDTASPAAVAEIREELAEEGYIRTKTRHKKQKLKTPQPDMYLSTSGHPIYVGRNNKQNEALTHRIAKPSDTWLHTKDIPGSHVVIRGQNYDQTTLEEAAMLAAYYSKAKGSSNVPVDYTLIKHVRKPNGAKPGFVTYTEQKTLFVTPDEQVIKQLLENNQVQS